MNILHLRYAVEVAKCGSINKAADILLMNQPNLSRAIRELEDSLGTKIFTRSAKGMTVTPDGEVFLRHADKILSQVDEVETIFKVGHTAKKHFSVSAPRAVYISHAFALFSTEVGGNGDTELVCEETDFQSTVKHVLDGECKLGIVRYPEKADKFCKSMLEDKGMTFEMLGEFGYGLLVSRESPLAAKETVTYADLRAFTELAYTEPFVPLSFAEEKKEELHENPHNRILINERSSQFDVLSHNTMTYMWSTPIGKKFEDAFGLVTKSCPENRVKYKDVIIRMKDYRMTELDSTFIAELCRTRREFFAE